MPALKNSAERYGLIAMILHWVMAMMIIGMLAVGIYMEGADKTPTIINLYGIHKSVGALMLMLVVLRITWRFANLIPPLPENMRKVEKLAAHASHYILYFFMFAMPMSGWLMSSAAGFSVSVFDWFTLPNLISANKDLRGLFGEAHEIMGYALIGFIVLHAAAALLHHFKHKDNVLRRMLPILLLCAAFPANAADAPSWTIDKASSTLTFTATQNNAPVTGVFEEFDGTIMFDPAAPQQGNVSITVNIGSVSASYEDIAVTLKTADWFDAAQFPQAVFEAANFTKTTDGAFSTEGTLTLRGVTIPTLVEFTLQEHEGATATATGFATLKRNDFGIGQGEWKSTDVVKDEVRVDFILNARH